MKLVVGLGNPGRPYASTRHNTGALCVQAFGASVGLTLDRKTRLATLAQGELDGHPLVLALPRAYVNVSGPTVADLLARFGGGPSDLVLIYDDMDLPLGAVRVRAQGSAGGHNGVKSVTAALGTERFPRLRIGIGRPSDGMDEVGYVLSAFTPAERVALDPALKLAVAALRCIVTEGMQAAMNQFNRRRAGQAEG